MTTRARDCCSKLDIRESTYSCECGTGEPKYNNELRGMGCSCNYAGRAQYALPDHATRHCRNPERQTENAKE